MKVLLKLFVIFFKVGTFTIGEGYAMIPFIEDEIVVKEKWISKDDFAGMLALAQSSPGPITVNIAVFVGYNVAGILGSISAACGAVFTASAIFIVIAMYYNKIQKSPFAERLFKGMTPAAIALIVAPVMQLSKNSKINKKTISIPIITVILVVIFNVNPIFIIMIAAVLGIIFGFIKRKKI